jgi:outer membrane lipoprotein-sorting protein
LNLKTTLGCLTLLGATLLPVLGRAQAANPANQVPKDILLKTLASYSGLKSFQSTWSYTLERGTFTQKLTVDLKSKGPTKVLFKVTAIPGQKIPPDQDIIPDLQVVLDGKTAWFENSTEKAYYKVPLPKNAQTSPLMFFPQMSVPAPVKRDKDIQVDGKTYFVIVAEASSGVITRMEIDASTYHLRKVSSEAVIGFIKTVSTISIEKETYDGDVSDGVFNFKASKGAKEMAAPADAGAIFAQGASDK